MGFEHPSYGYLDEELMKELAGETFVKSKLEKEVFQENFGEDEYGCSPHLIGKVDLKYGPGPVPKGYFNKNG